MVHFIDSNRALQTKYVDPDGTFTIKYVDSGRVFQIEYAFKCSITVNKIPCWSWHIQIQIPSQSQLNALSKSMKSFIGVNRVKFKCPMGVNQMPHGSQSNAPQESFKCPTGVDIFNFNENHWLILWIQVI